MTAEAVTAVRAPDARSRFRLYVWAVLGLTVAVIVSGDIVQATESGAGCGESWPRCDGSLIPAIGDAGTAVEFTHRMATTLLSLSFVGLVFGAWRYFGREHPVWRATLVATAFLVAEILIGAALVLFGWVEDDASWGRVVADGLHVVNTFLLLAAVTIVASLAADRPLPRLRLSRRADRLVLAAVAIVLLIAVTGTINSLADTLYLSDSVDVDATPIAAILVTIRGVHPVVAVAGGVAIVYLTIRLTELLGEAAPRPISLVQVIIGLQFVVGVLNILLLTPLETQVIHLILADALWISLLLVALALPSRDQRPRPASSPTPV